MKYSLDLLLNKVSMYRILSITLSVLVGFSIVLALFGQLPYSAGAMAASAGTLALAAYLANVALGKLFDVRTHNESSYITALILFFIVSPTLEVKGLAVLALVAMFAMASKYLLVIRGRHIFNPAAIAAATASAIGLTYAAWWVATPILLPLVAFLAFLVLYKTRRLELGLLFTLTASVIIITLSMIDGQPLGEATMALLSWPLIFFAGFMLSEPLTLPPRRWQQYLVGVIVAVLFAVPFKLGDISSSPAVALVAGNLIAFIFTQRRHIKLRYKGYKALTDMTYEYTFKPLKPIRFTPGQYMEITIPHSNKDGRGIRRTFSIIDNKDDSTIKFAVKIPDRPSSFKQALQSLKVEHTVHATGVNGDFVLPKNLSEPLLFVAGGVGITPFISYISSPECHMQTRDTVLIYSVSSPAEIIYINALKNSGIRIIIVSKTTERMPDPSWLHLNNLHIDSDEIAKAVPDIANRVAFVSGPPLMVDAAKSALKRQGAKHIRTDYFTGY